ncbi:MAG: hypothetical protein AVDCRST_MAG68-5517, partial [uncultured Gemmatimonadetes bacterium]
WISLTLYTLRPLLETGKKWPRTSPSWTVHGGSESGERITPPCLCAPS